MSGLSRFTGIVKWFNVTKGFGFIESESVSGDIFVHHREVPKVKRTGIRRLFDRQTVSFELNEGEKGFFAADVVVVADPPLT